MEGKWKNTSVEHRWNDTEREGRSTPWKNMSQCHFDHHKSHTECCRRKYILCPIRVTVQAVYLHETRCQWRSKFSTAVTIWQFTREQNRKHTVLSRMRLFMYEYSQTTRMGIKKIALLVSFHNSVCARACESVSACLCIEIIIECRYYYYGLLYFFENLLLMLTFLCVFHRAFWYNYAI